MAKALNILVVDDSPADQRLTREALDRIPAVRKLHIVSNGIEALDHLHRIAESSECFPNLVLLDLNMPQKSGFDVLLEMKNDATLRLIPVVIFTSSLSSEDIERCYARFANCYIVKPTDLEPFFHVLKTLCDFWSTVAESPTRDSR
jgi:two-component system response regulator